MGAGSTHPSWPGRDKGQDQREHGGEYGRGVGGVHCRPSRREAGEPRVEASHAIHDETGNEDVGEALSRAVRIGGALEELGCLARLIGSGLHSCQYRRPSRIWHSDWVSAGGQGEPEPGSGLRCIHAGRAAEEPDAARNLRQAQQGIVLLGRVVLGHVNATLVDLAQRGFIRIDGADVEADRGRLLTDLRGRAARQPGLDERLLKQIHDFRHELRKLAVSGSTEAVAGLIPYVTLFGLNQLAGITINDDRDATTARRRATEVPWSHTDRASAPERRGQGWQEAIRTAVQRPRRGPEAWGQWTSVRRLVVNRRHVVRRMIVVVSAVAGAAVLVLALLAWSGNGPFAAEPRELTFMPLEVHTLGEAGDPLLVEVIFPWTNNEFCSGQFTVSARESGSEILVSQVKGFEVPPDVPCAGLGSDGRVAGAYLTLSAPLGDRVVTRAVDGAALPVLDPCEKGGVPAWCPKRS